MHFTSLKSILREMFHHITSDWVFPGVLHYLILLKSLFPQEAANCVQMYRAM